MGPSPHPDHVVASLVIRSITMIIRSVAFRKIYDAVGMFIVFLQLRYNNVLHNKPPRCYVKLPAAMVRLFRFRRLLHLRVRLILKRCSCQMTRYTSRDFILCKKLFENWHHYADRSVRYRSMQVLTL